MIFIAERGSEQYHHLVLGSPADFRAPFDARPWTCLLWDAAGTADGEERARLSADLVASGCVYAVCGGIGCEAWHDALDEALIGLQEAGRVPDDHFVATTWHEGETVDDVTRFFVLDAVPATGGVDRHLVLQIGEDRDRRNDLWTLVRAHVIHGGDESASG